MYKRQGPGELGPQAPRRQRLAASWRAIHEHELALRIRLDSDLAGFGDRVRGHSHAADRTPTTLLTFPGRRGWAAYEFLASRGVQAVSYTHLCAATPVCRWYDRPRPVLPARTHGALVDMRYDLTALRAQFPSLASGLAHFDGPGGTQSPRAVGAAIAATLTGPLSNRGRLGVSERNADDAVGALSLIHI